MATVKKRTLLKISEELDEEEVKDMRFLCSDHIPTGKRVENAQDLFKLLEELNLDICYELLYQIKRYKLLSDLEIHDMEQFLKQPGNCKISNYRVLIYNISKEIDVKELNSIIYVLNIPKGKCKSLMNLMDLCTELEKEGKISPNDLQLLLNALDGIKRRDLKKKVEIYLNDAIVVRPLQESRKQQGLEMCTQDTDQKIRCPAEVDARPIISSGTNTHQEVQQTPSIVDDPTAENTNVQGEECSSAEQNTSTASSSDVMAGTLQSLSISTNSKPIEEYKMDSTPLGICLILNNNVFTDTKYRKRNGTDHDAEKLKKVFEDLGFEVHRHNNSTAKEIENILKHYQTFDHNAMDCFVCCILSHGEKDIIVGTDGKRLQISDIRFWFSGSQCPSLLRKPKIFFIQACQGTRKQKACFITGGDSDLETDASVPEDRDFLFAISTVPDFVSYRTQEGSWFIQTLCTCLEEYCCKKYDLLMILTEVNRRVSERNVDAKQIPEPRFTLSKKLVILPLSLRTCKQVADSTSVS
ncbi:caspase-8-like isoform X2 [Leucoraja erinacea]|uniref:caspase-8-like isoform X2 n=1 Tax=Leucoraja erinaceus TaxID=7782 RepID=UPI0024571222|nr:caspase-8-like isoform X2 [Leucoraja erinacea]